MGNVKNLLSIIKYYILIILTENINYNDNDIQQTFNGNYIYLKVYCGKNWMFLLKKKTTEVVPHTWDTKMKVGSYSYINSLYL